MSRSREFLKRQLQTPLSPDYVERPSKVTTVTDGLASGVEFVGLVVLFGGVGWLIYHVTGQIGWFVGLLVFGILGTMLRTYYTSKAGMDRASEEIMEIRANRTRPSSGRGLGGLLEGDLDPENTDPNFDPSRGENRA